MARYTGPKCRLCRREGEKLFLKGERCFSKCPLDGRKRYPPGVHGPDRRRKLSIYGLQLREKQKVKRMYGVLEAQFRKFFEWARKMPGNTGENLLSLLERRLDNVVYRLGIASSRSQARQLVNHGHIRVNGKKVDIASYLVKPGDTVTISERSKKIRFIQDNLEGFDVSVIPTWLIFDKNKIEGKVVRNPIRSDIMYPVNETLIIELYSK